MPKTADQADATTREILGPQFTAMRNLVEAAENSRQKADAVAKAQAEHVEIKVVAFHGHGIGRPFSHRARPARRMHADARDNTTPTTQ